jgi:hypothetical protein
VLLEEILKWPQMREGCDVHALTSYLAARANRRLSSMEVEEALGQLAVRELITRDGDRIWLSEPDRRELDLYGPLEGLLKSAAVLERIGVLGSELVLQNTALGGVRGNGPLTRPDFTLAAIRSWRFDPQRTLEVFSFEVKNRAGATVPAVYEAVAHGRFVHYPYLVCPRSRLNDAANEVMRTACVREGIGLIVFDIVVPGDGGFAIEQVEVVQEAERRTHDPLLVQRYLESRLSDENCVNLEAYVKRVGR